MSIVEVVGVTERHISFEMHWGLKTVILDTVNVDSCRLVDVLSLLTARTMYNCV
jgi:hypothetical protein